MLPAPCMCPTEYPRKRRLTLRCAWNAQVFKARYLKKLVAIKVLMDDSPEQQQAFLAEALLLRDLRHPHIVQYLGHIQMDGKVCHSMQRSWRHCLDCILSQLNMTFISSLNH